MIAPTSPPALVTTARLQLLRAAPEHLEALMVGVAAFEEEFGLHPEVGFLEFPEALECSLRQMAGGGYLAHWWAPYLFVERAGRTVVGMGGYKGPPDAHGLVEIGYGVAPAWRGRGVATEAAAALTAEARCLPRVKGVCAHTLPQPNASTRVLTKCGFRQAGEGEDPDEGLVWRWEHVA